EGPYGRMNPRHARDDAAQVWVAGGIGITPFLAWLESMHHAPAAAPVTMHYCVRNAATDPFVERVIALCAQLPNVKLRLHDASLGNRLAAQPVLAATQPVNGKMDLWFCGPSGFAKSLEQGMKELLGRGFRIHREVFEMR